MLWGPVTINMARTSRISGTIIWTHISIFLSQTWKEWMRRKASFSFWNWRFEKTFFTFFRFDKIHLTNEEKEKSPNCDLINWRCFAQISLFRFLWIWGTRFTWLRCVKVFHIQFTPCFGMLIQVAQKGVWPSKVKLNWLKLSALPLKKILMSLQELSSQGCWEQRKPFGQICSVLIVYLG